jgi:hypothetical protein
MNKVKIHSPNSNFVVELYNVNGTERVVIKNNKLYLSNYFTPDYHHKIEKIAGKEFRCIYVDPEPKCEYYRHEKLNKKNLEERNLNKNHLVEVYNLCL